MDFTIAVFLAAMLVLVCLAAGTNVLRSAAGSPRAHGASRKSPFSLGRLQMAWWLLIILAAFLALAMARHQVGGVMNRPTAMILAIAAATLFGAFWVERVTVPPHRRPDGSNFLADVLCDENGLCLHRLQFLVWNAVLGMSFVWTVVTDASMPMFDSYTLAILAISGATFVGFKRHESARIAAQG
jgi:hypothetical protein